MNIAQYNNSFLLLMTSMTSIRLLYGTKKMQALKNLKDLKFLKNY